MSKVIERARKEERPVPPAAEYDLPAPPVPPCTPEEHDAWFRTKVQEALDDPNPTLLSTEEVEASLDTIIERKLREKEERVLARS